MSIWKLVRQCYGSEEYILSEGDEVTLGRSTENIIVLTSAVVSRKHCLIKFLGDTVLVTDFKSANGVYIAGKKISPNIPCVARNFDIIGIGWNSNLKGIVEDTDKYEFKLLLVSPPVKTIKDDNKIDEIEEKLSSFESNGIDHSINSNLSTENNRKDLKRKVDLSNKEPEIVTIKNEIINIISDSENEIKLEEDVTCKKPKLSAIDESPKIEAISINTAICENDYMPFEAFNVKQNHWKGSDIELIEIDSDSDIDNDSGQWFARLSQNSPGKPLKKLSQQIGNELKLENSSYSQIEDLDNVILDNDENEYDSDVAIATADETDGSWNISLVTQDKMIKNINTDHIGSEPKTKSLRESHEKNSQEKTTYKSSKVDTKSSSSKSSKTRKENTSKQDISISDKEARKKKLKELALLEKEKKAVENESTTIISNKSKVYTKPSNNRGAFLTDAEQIVKPLDKKEKHENQSNKKRSSIDNKTNAKDNKTVKNRHNKDNHTTHEKQKNYIVPLKDLKPLSDREDASTDERTILGKPFNKVEPLLPKKSKKRVRFSDAGPKVHVFQIEPGNRMKKTSLVKTTLLDIRHVPKFSSDKITLIKILRWNPHWLYEQTTTEDPPPILGHDKLPTSIFHSFSNHRQYIQQVGDLLLMEIWESLSVAYMKGRDQRNEITMQIECMPTAPLQESNFDLTAVSVNMSVPTADIKKVPRIGEVLLVTFGPENGIYSRFFFVHNVRSLPSPPSNKNSFFSITLYAANSQKIMSLRQGEVISAKPLAYINNELLLFEAMDYLSMTPLGNIILRPEPYHFPPVNMLPISTLQWNETLNDSQKMAVNASVAAALSDRPSIQMVQGPPGTGKSSVICCMVMSYFYDAQNRRNHNRGKILICATSNAAVDALVIRLLNIRQTLPKSERFRMVRVGRAESMHPRALLVSSQHLAHRDHARTHAAAHPAAAQEICHLEAKLNMWKTAEQDAKDPVRIAYCQTRISEIMKRIALVRQDGGSSTKGVGGAGGEALAQAERRIVEGADIVLTTLASAHSHKTRGLKRRIALCIIDEAGQVIEPETLIPLMLDVTHITLVGDPQQLPGYICSQRAKKHGLGESLFARLTSCTELWPHGSPVVLLDQQYRMHAHIVDYPNRAFYDSKIKTCVSLRPALSIPPYSVISVTSADKGQGASGNEAEAWCVSRLAAALDAHLRTRALSLAVITPYNAHKELIKRNLQLLHCEQAALDVNTVDSFQGQERDVVVVSLARSHGVGFLTDTGRMNVMLTRARHALLICLNPFAMMKNNQWRTLIEDAQQRDMYTMFPAHLCQPVTPDEPRTDDLLKHLFPKIIENSNS